MPKTTNFLTFYFYGDNRKLPDHKKVYNLAYDQDLKINQKPS